MRKKNKFVYYSTITAMLASIGGAIYNKITK